MYRNRTIFLTLLIIFLGYIPGTVSAEAKIGLVNLDALFKEIPISVSYTHLRAHET